ncbi:MAG: hypothetical protein M3162_07265 [Thermoproteota archaeon]|nr:hypothetical protein [Thermoproteota archaeon]
MNNDLATINEEFAMVREHLKQYGIRQKRFMDIAANDQNDYPKPSLVQWAPSFRSCSQSFSLDFDREVPIGTIYERAKKETTFCFCLPLGNIQLDYSPINIHF